MSMIQKWKRVALISASSGMSQVLTLIFGLLLVRVLDDQDYAVYRQGMLLVNTLLPLFALLSPISLSYFFARAETEREKKEFVIQTVEALGLLSLLGALAVLILQDQISTLYNNELLKVYIPAFAVILFVESTTQYFSYYMVCINKEKVLMAVTVTFSFLRTLLLIGVLLLQTDILKRFMLLYTAAEICRGAFILGYTIHLNRGARFVPRAGTLAMQFKFSVPIYIMGIINALNANLDKNIVAILYRPEMYTVYENGAYQIPFVSTISSGIIAVMLPDIAQRFKAGDKPALDGIINEYRGVIRIAFAVFAAIFAALFTFSEGVILFLFTERYIESVRIFRVYLLMLLFQALNLGVLLTSADRQKDILKAGIVMVAANFALLVVLNRLMGFYQLVYAPVTATLVMNLCLLYFIRKTYMQASIWNVMPVCDMFCLILPMAAVGAGFFRLRGIVPLDGVIETVILGPACFAAEAAVAFAILNIIRERRKD